MHIQFAMQLKFLELDFQLRCLRFFKLEILCYILPYHSVFVKDNQCTYLIKTHSKKSRKGSNYRICNIGMEKGHVKCEIL